MGEVIRTAPERIYLITGDECPLDANFADLSEVTWCEDDVGGGIEYVRADLAEAKLRAELERRESDGWKLVPVEPTESMLLTMTDPFIAISGDNRTAFYKAYRNMLAAAPSAPATVQGVNHQLLEALEFYARGDHLVLFDDDAWDTCSCEPMNWLHDNAGTASVEDG